ncbi:DNA-processing protein DprA, partial [Candidatus Dojkabacteria bacterium]|nr:DNA-processing protein DprA [Candidatus Dojkabacteria bacterium]
KKEIYFGLDKFLSAFELYKFLSNNSNAKLPQLKDIKADSEFITYSDINYPALLKEINDPPLVLFYRGNADLFSDINKVSIVGTRRPTKYGVKVTKDICSSLAKSNSIVVSGMAFGVDSVAHSVTLEHQGKTIAVLGANVNEPYPRTNKKLYEQIISHDGLVISETQSREINKWIFPRRNRIIAGLSRKTYVIEAAAKSGAIITANLAFDYNREVYAIPGNIYSEKSAGCNNLIKSNKAEIFCNNNELIDNEGSELNLSKEELKILEQLEVEDLNIQQISKKLNIDFEAIFKIILGLEIKKKVAKQSGGLYTLT